MSEWLKHHGIKGMRWGVRKQLYKLSNGYKGAKTSFGYARNLRSAKAHYNRDMGKIFGQSKVRLTKSVTQFKKPTSILTPNKTINLKGRFNSHVFSYKQDPNVRRINVKWRSEVKKGMADMARRRRNKRILAGTIGATALTGLSYGGYRLYKKHKNKQRRNK